MTDTDELTTWLAATLDTVEAAVIAYRDGHSGPCLNYDGQHPEAYDERDSCYLHIRAAEASPYRDASFGLADIAAKRRILDRHVPKTGEHLPRHPICAECGGSDWKPLGGRLEPYPWVMPWPCPTLRLLALAFAGYPGYRNEWRPA